MKEEMGNQHPENNDIEEQRRAAATVIGVILNIGLRGLATDLTEQDWKDAKAAWTAYQRLSRARDN